METDSPFQHVLGTNYVPSDAEVHRIHELISEPLSKLSLLNEEIARMQVIIDSLTLERDKLTEDIDAHRALISRVRRLPQELIQEIFVCCIPTSRNAVMSAKEAPILLGRICSAWRRIALSTPQLWSSLHIVVPNHPVKSCENLGSRSDFVKLWLELSGIRPLSVSLAAHYIDEETSSQWVKLLIPFSRRWKSIEFRIRSSALHTILDLTKEDVPMLEAIEICDPPYTTSGLALGNMAILGGPRICSVSFPSLLGNPSALTLPWARLTRLALASSTLVGHFELPTEVALRLLRQCPALLSCMLQLTSSNFPVQPTESVTLLALGSLHLVRTYRVDLTEFLNYLILPALRDLEIRGGSILNHQEEMSFISFLGWTPALSSLTLEVALTSDEPLIEFLRLTPALTRLYFTDMNGMHSSRTPKKPALRDTVIRLLTPTPQRSGLCPALKIIKFRNCDAFSDEILLAFIHARSTSVHPDVARLKRADFSFNHKVEVDILPQIQPLAEAGLEISLSYSPSPPQWSDSPWEGLLDENFT